MLILTRKPGESLYIGDDIKITIVELKGHQIRVGIEAPKEMRIYREEIYLQILEENKSAAATPEGFERGLENLTAAWSQRASAGSAGGSSGGGDSEDKPRRGGLAGLSTLKASGSRGGVTANSPIHPDEGGGEKGEAGAVAQTSSIGLGSLEGPRPGRVRRDPGSADVPVVVRRKRPKKVDE